MLHSWLRIQIFFQGMSYLIHIFFSNSNDEMTNVSIGSSMQTRHSAVECQRDGYLTQSVPSCDNIFCGTPPNVENGAPAYSHNQSYVGDFIQ